MATMTAKDFWGLVQAILPFYVILLIAYGMTKKNIFQKVHAPGLTRWTSIVGIPIYVGNMVAFNDPYATNLRLVGADVLQKVVVLILAGIWWRFSKNGSIDGVIKFFMLGTLSNMVLVGPALFQPLHGDSSKISIATIIILQCVLWYNLCIVLFETRVVLLEMETDTIVLHSSELVEVDQHFHDSGFGHLPGLLEDEKNMKSTAGDGGDLSGNDDPKLQRTTSAPARVCFSASRVAPWPQHLLSSSQVSEHGDDEDNEVEVPSSQAKGVEQGSHGTHGMGTNTHEHLQQSTLVIKSGGAIAATEVLQPHAFSDGQHVHHHHHHQRQPSTVSIDVSQPIRIEVSQSLMIEVSDPADKFSGSGVEGLKVHELPKLGKIKYARIVAYKVLNRVKYAPLTYTSVVGFVYSLLAFKYVGFQALSMIHIPNFISIY